MQIGAEIYIKNMRIFAEYKEHLYTYKAHIKNIMVFSGYL